MCLALLELRDRGIECVGEIGTLYLSWGEFQHRDSMYP